MERLSCASRAVLKVERLESLAMDSYLIRLEKCCAAFIFLSRMDTQVLSGVRANLIKKLKEELNSHLCGTASSSLRQDMITKVMSGRYPSAEYHNQYDTADNEGLSEAFFESEGDAKVMEEVRQSGKKCNSMCCTGAFIVETMLSILINVDVRKLNFNVRQARRTLEGGLFWNKNKILRKYVHFQVPAILAHYKSSIKKANSEIIPKLESLIVSETNIPTRDLAARRYHFDVLTSFSETVGYLEVPGVLSACAGEHKRQYGAYSEHLIYALSDLFSFSDVAFEKLTEIVLGMEACNSRIKMTGSDNCDVNLQLFRGIGRRCPNLKVLDVSEAISLRADCILFLLLHDPYLFLHRYMYLPEFIEDSEFKYFQNEHCEVDKVKHHNEIEYCPWCLDPWCSNNLRENHEFAGISFSVLDERVYTGVIRQFKEEGKHHLVNVVSATDLVRCVDLTTLPQLVRPKGPAPWESGFNESNHTESFLKDYEFYWCMPPTPARYEETPIDFSILLPVAKSLQCLKLNIDGFWPKWEIVPFLLKVLPQIKSLGHVNIVKGLKMIRGTIGLEGIKAKSLEEIDFGLHSSLTGYFSEFWTNESIVSYVEDVIHHLFDETEDSPEERREVIKKDVELVAEECPNLKRMKVYILSETPFLRTSDTQIWEGFKKLEKLKEITLYAHGWPETVALFQTIGEQLTKLYLSLDGRGHILNDLGEGDYAPKLEDVLNLMPNLEDITFSFGLKRVQVTSSNLGSLTTYPKLRKFCVHTFMTKKAFSYLWSRAPNLVSIRINSLTEDETLPAMNFNTAEFNTSEIINLFSRNQMLYLKSFDVLISLKDIPTAKQFIEKMYQVDILKTLSIRVGLPEENYPNQEQMLLSLAQVMQSMRQFKMFCLEKSLQGQNIQWKWERFGFLQSFAEIEQLNALIEPNIV